MLQHEYAFVTVGFDTAEKEPVEVSQRTWGMLNGSVRAHKVRAIGVSNYCRACMECLADAEVKPMVNQVHYQIGMGPDPQGFKSYAASQGVVLQAY